MAEETKGDSAVVEDPLYYIIEVMRQNETFLRQNAEETYHEVVELINDAIDYVVLAAKKSGEDYVRYSMISFLNHILMPFSYAIHVDTLAGNIPACFMELRLMLESLVKCYLADLEYPDRTFFQERLKLLEDENLSTSELMKDLGRKLELGNAFVALWSKLSQNWIHTKGIMDGVVAQVIEKSDVPPWGLVLPMRYSERELDTLDELRNNISKFISLLKTTMEKYQKENNLTMAD